MRALNAVTLDEWLDDYRDLVQVGIMSSGRTEGLCKLATGGRFLFGRVMLEFTPSDKLVFEMDIEPDKYNLCVESCWNTSIFLGVLDVMLVAPETPITNFRCRLIELDYHEADSSRIAFRLAARNATRRYIETEPYTILV
jgi:hypothetical protein